MKITSHVKDYEVHFDAQILSRPKEFRKSISGKGKLFFFIDANITKIYSTQMKDLIGDSPYLEIEATEQNKSYLKLADYYSFLIDNGFTREDTLVTVGGGILQDLSGFVATSLYRGLKWILIPTTLLAQADSCIGSKTSINFRDFKNLIGTFYPPDRIFIDPRFCESLSDSDFNSGLGEIIKFHLQSNESGYAYLREFLDSPNKRDPKVLNEAIESTLMIKKSYFEGDETDKGRRNLLNYGHCFGHALESASHFAVSHGEAVIAGMGFANLLSMKRGLLSPSKYQEFENILSRHYPKYELSQLSPMKIIDSLKRDKKRVGSQLTMILCRDVGLQEKHDDVTETEVTSVFKEFLPVFNPMRSV